MGGTEPVPPTLSPRGVWSQTPKLYEVYEVPCTASRKCAPPPKPRAHELKGYLAPATRIRIALWAKRGKCPNLQIPRDVHPIPHPCILQENWPCCPRGRAATGQLMSTPPGLSWPPASPGHPPLLATRLRRQRGRHVQQNAEGAGCNFVNRNPCGVVLPELVAAWRTGENCALCQLTVGTMGAEPAAWHPMCTAPWACSQ